MPSGTDSEWWVPLEAEWDKDGVVYSGWFGLTPLQAVSFNTAFPEPLYLKVGTARNPRSRPCLNSPCEVQQDTSGEFRVLGLGVGESSDCTGGVAPANVRARN